MSANNLQQSKNRIAPPFLKIFLVLILFLSSIVLIPTSLGFSDLNQNPQDPISYTPSLHVSEELPLFHEKINVIIGKNDSLISVLELNGGEIRTPFDLSSSELVLVNQLDFIVNNQSSFSKIWTNPLWQFPDGLVIRLTARTQDYNRLISIYRFVDNIIRNFYGVTPGVFNLRSLSSTDTVISLVAPISYTQALEIFQEIFVFEDQVNNGNTISLMGDLLSQSPAVYAFGYSIQKRLGSISRLTKSVLIGVENKIPHNGDQRSFNLEDVFGAALIPNSHALLTNFAFHVPFLVNITYMNPLPDNMGGTATGSFEWILKYLTIISHPSFNLDVIYYPFTYDDFIFPRITVSNSYSDFKLENDGVLNMTYTINNTGTDTAFNTSIVLPIPFELGVFVQEGLVIPVLKETIQINESFTSYVELKISYSVYSFSIPIIDIQGWYENSSTLMPERWLDENIIELNEYVSIHCSNGISSDLLFAIETHIIPILEIGIDEIMADFGYYEPLIVDSLKTAATESYEIAFEAFYENKTIFQFSSSDFIYNSNPYGGYLEHVIPQIEVDETLETSWTIFNIPTSADRYGGFSWDLKTVSYDEYIVFQTSERDYKDFMLSVFAAIDSAGRFLSVHDPITGVFVSLGSRYQYADSLGRKYFGLTNGLNLQIGDDEAVLESILNMNSTIYRVGDEVPFSLDITNLGTIEAYDIHVDIVNLKLNYLWLPTDVVVVKSFDIDQINAGEHIKIDFSAYANSYIGLNTYVAIISFISDKDQVATEVIDLWTGQPVPWEYSGETTNVITSTLTFGVLFPPLLLEDELRPSFPLPEITTSNNYEIDQEKRELLLEYEITNTGLSSTDLTLYQVFPKGQGDLEYLNCSLIQGDTIITLEPVISTKGDYYFINYVNITLEPGDKILVEARLSNISEDFTIPPIIIKYYSIYQIHTTDFATTNSQTEVNTANPASLYVKASPSTVIEGGQNQFIWSSFSPVIHINLPFSSEYERIIFSSLPWLYPVISTAILGGLILIAMIISRTRK